MSDHALLQYNKVWAKVRTLQSLNQSQLRLCHQAAQVQISMQGAMVSKSKQRHLTVYEAALLRDSKKLEEHQQSLKAAAGVSAECNQAMHGAHTFFTWVASLHQSWLQTGYLQPVSKTGSVLQTTQACSNQAQVHELHSLPVYHLVICP